MAGLVIAGRDALVLLAGLLVVALAFGFARFAWAWLVVFALDWRTYVAVIGALVIMVALKPGGYQHG